MILVVASSVPSISAFISSFSVAVIVCSLNTFKPTWNYIPPLLGSDTSLQEFLHSYNGSLCIGYLKTLIFTFNDIILNFQKLKHLQFYISGILIQLSI